MAGPERFGRVVNDPVVRCQLRPGARIALKVSRRIASTGRVITSIYSLRLKRLELLSSGSYREARVLIHALCRS